MDIIVLHEMYFNGRTLESRGLYVEFPIELMN